MRYAIVLPLFVVGVAIGCGHEMKKENQPVRQGEALLLLENKHAAIGEKAALAEAEKKAADVPRKIKYTCEIRLIVAEIAPAAAQLAALVKEHKGYIAQSEESTSPGAIRQGMWRVRVPVSASDDFRDAVRKLGDVEKNTMDSVDVTEEYHDLKNHIKNKLVEEEGLRDILKKMSEKTDKVEAFLQVRDRLSEVRDYINRMEGKLRLLENLTDLATVTVYLREKSRFEPELPPERAEAPTFGQRIGRTFSDSLAGLLELGKLLVLFVVGVAPWVVPLAVVGIPAWVIARRRRGEVEAAKVEEAGQETEEKK